MSAIHFVLEDWIESTLELSNNSLKVPKRSMLNSMWDLFIFQGTELLIFYILTSAKTPRNQTQPDSRPTYNLDVLTMKAIIQQRLHFSFFAIIYFWWKEHGVYENKANLICFYMHPKTNSYTSAALFDYMNTHTHTDGFQITSNTVVFLCTRRHIYLKKLCLQYKWQLISTWRGKNTLHFTKTTTKMYLI